MKNAYKILEAAKWILIAVIFIILLFPKATQAQEPFAPKAKHYKTSSYKKHKAVKKSAFVCTKTKKVNRKGLMR